MFSLHRARQDLHCYSWACWLTCDKGHYFSQPWWVRGTGVSLLCLFFRYMLCLIFLMPLWDSGCDDYDWPFWSQIREGFLWNAPPPQKKISLLAGGRGNASPFLGNLGCGLSYVFSRNPKMPFVSIKMMTVSERFPKSLWEIIRDVVPWF